MELVICGIATRIMGRVEEGVVVLPWPRVNSWGMAPGLRPITGVVRMGILAAVAVDRICGERMAAPAGSEAGT